MPSYSFIMEKWSERSVSVFPLAYDSFNSPYQKTRFDVLVRDHCERAFKSPRVGKCVVVGDLSVGKTSLVNRFGYNVFSNNYKATIGVDFDVQKFSILDQHFS